MRVSKETAILAKLCGFPQECSHFYCDNYEGLCSESEETLSINNLKDVIYDCNNEFNEGTRYNAPTQSELQTWLRDVHNCLVIVDYHSRIETDDFTPNGFKSKSDIKFKVEIDYYGTNFEIEQGEETDYLNYNFDSYEDALEDGLVIALMMLPNLNN